MIVKIHKPKSVIHLLIILISIAFCFKSEGRQFRTLSSGQWNIPATWQYSTNGGATWLAAPGSPSLLNDTTIIKTGHTVAVYNSIGPYTGPATCGTLIVQSGAKIWAGGGAANIYINVFGDIKDTGIIGNGATFDNLSFNIEGANCLISGGGAFDVSRMRKNSNINVTTNLTIAMNVNLRFASSSQTQIYNNYTLGSSTFNVTINNGFTLNLTGSGTNTGNASIDGIDGFGTNERGGTFTINGNLIVSGAIYLTTDNLTASNNWVIGSTGVVTCSQIIAAASGPGGCYLTINNGGVLKINGINSGQSYLYNTVTYSPANGGFNAYSSTNNVYTFNSGSTVEYSGAGDQNVETSLTYSNLTFSGTGNKIIAGNLTVNNNFTMQGSAVLPGLTYTINIGGNWNTYSPSAFTESTSTVVFNGYNGTLQTIVTVGSDEVFYKLELNNTVSNVQLNCLVTVSNNLNLINGKLLLNSNQLTININAVTGITRTNGFIVSEATNNSSKIKWKLLVGATPGAYVFPFGLLNGNYIPFTFTKTSGSYIFVTVATYGTPANNLPWPASPVAVTNLASGIGLAPDNRDATVDRFWEIDVTGSGVADLDFTYQPSELPIAPYNTPNAMQAQRYNGATDIWETPLPGQTASAYSTQVSGVTTFGVSPWTLSTSLSPLPVNWLSFDVSKSQQKAILNWFISDEQGNSYYTIQRSTDANNFKTIGVLSASQTQQSVKQYSYTDSQPVDGVNYYRIGQTDINGKSTFTNIKQIRFDNKLAEDFTFYGSNTMYYLNFNKIQFTKAVIRITDVMGKEVYRQEIVSNKSDGSYALADLNFAKGIYVISFIADDRLITKKIIL